MQISAYSRGFFALSLLQSGGLAGHRSQWKALSRSSRRSGAVAEEDLQGGRQSQGASQGGEKAACRRRAGRSIASADSSMDGARRFAGLRLPAVHRQDECLGCGGVPKENRSDCEAFVGGGAQARIAGIRYCRRAMGKANGGKGVLSLDGQAGDPAGDWVNAEI